MPIELADSLDSDTSADSNLPDDRRVADRASFRTVAKVAFAVKGAGAGSMRLWTEDVSMGGACLIAHEDLPCDEIYLQLLLPGSHHAVFRGQIVRRTIRRRISLTCRMWREYSYGVRIVEQISNEDLPDSVDFDLVDAGSFAPIFRRDDQFNPEQSPVASSENQSQSDKGGEAGLSEDELRELLGRTVDVSATVPEGRTYVPLLSAIGLVVVYVWFDLMV